MTLQTESPLVKQEMQGLSMTLDWIVTSSRSPEDRFDMEQPYQRGLVWGRLRKMNLVKSFLLGVPVPGIVVNDRFAARFSESEYDQNRNWRYSVIDGKQRVTTVIEFIDNQLSVPASWFDAEDVTSTVDTEDGPYVRFSDLSIRAQRSFRHSTIAVTTARVKTLAEEEVIFSLINEGGLAQGEQDSDL